MNGKMQALDLDDLDQVSGGRRDGIRHEFVHYIEDLNDDEINYLKTKKLWPAGAEGRTLKLESWHSFYCVRKALVDYDMKRGIGGSR